MVIMNRVAPPVASARGRDRGVDGDSGGGESDRNLVSEFEHGIRGSEPKYSGIPTRPFHNGFFVY